MRKNKDLIGYVYQYKQKRRTEDNQITVQFFHGTTYYESDISQLETKEEQGELKDLFVSSIYVGEQCPLYITLEDFLEEYKEPNDDSVEEFADDLKYYVPEYYEKLNWGVLKVHEGLIDSIITLGLGGNYYNYDLILNEAFAYLLGIDTTTGAYYNNLLTEALGKKHERELKAKLG